jgi:hypothetical protein
MAEGVTRGAHGEPGEKDGLADPAMDGGFGEVVTAVTNG